MQRTTKLFFFFVLIIQFLHIKVLFDDGEATIQTLKWLQLQIRQRDYMDWGVTCQKMLKKSGWMIPSEEILSWLDGCVLRTV